MTSPFDMELRGQAAIRAAVPLEFEDLRDSSRQEAVEILQAVMPATNSQHEDDALVELDERLRSLTELHEREVAAAREQTRVAVGEELAAEMENRIERERQAIVRACEQFSKERTRYFAAIEKEIVRLSLAIASRVLHRETEMDPLLLQGVVRVALDKVRGSEVVTLRIPEDQLGDWKRILAAAHHEDVTVSGDGRLEAGECVLDTTVGRVDLGIKAQLEEIEKGFFDLLQQRPS